MRTKYLILIFLGVCTICLLGFYPFRKTPTPEEIGFHSATIDDRGLIELAVDEIRQGIRTGNPEMIQNLVAGDFIESTTPGFRANRSRKAALERTLTRTKEHPKATHTTLSVEHLEITERRALVTTTMSQDGGRPGEVKLEFEKPGNHWKLVRTAGLLSFLGSDKQLSPDRLAKNSATTAYLVYSEANDGAPRTLMPRPVSEEHGIERLTRAVTAKKLNRQLFQKPYAGVLVSTVRQFKEAPFFSAQYVQLVTDPAWNRVVYGDYEGWLKAYGDVGQGPEGLSRPHGIDRDFEGNIYVADTGNNRIVVLALAGTGENTELAYRFDFGSDQLVHPYDVAWDDAGSPSHPGDDVIWVADAGSHRVLGFVADGNSATMRYTYGRPGKAVGSFLEPKALAVGRFNGYANGSLFVADSGNRRLVKLVKTGSDLEWQAHYSGKSESQFTSVAVDHWGNVYATDRSYREIIKLGSDLQPLTALVSDEKSLQDPVDLSVTYGRFDLESENKEYWAGFDQAFVLEKWSETSGGERYQLGIDLEDFEVEMSGSLDRVRVRSMLTDHGKMSVAILEAETNRIVRQMPLGWRVPGAKEVDWDRRDDIGWQVEPGYYRLQLVAESGYGNSVASKETPDFYLPLFYWEDSGSEVHRDAHLVQGVRSSEWGAEPYQSVAKHPSEVVYRFTELNPTAEYEISAEFYHEGANQVNQTLAVDGISVFEQVEVTSEPTRLDWAELPREVSQDGQIEVRISKNVGDGDASVSQLWLREANFDPAHPPVQNEGEPPLPGGFTLGQNYPNPFNPSTTIEFGVPPGDLQKVMLRVFNVLGQTVKVLVDESLPAGRHSVVWDGKDSFGQPIASGVYFYELNAGELVEVRKLTLMK